MIKQARKILLLLSLAAIAGSIVYLQSLKPQRTTLGEGSEIAPRADIAGKEEKAKKYPLAKEIASPAGFINTEKITVGELVGKKVVLIDFWTYSCINCQRSTPYVNLWYEKYRGKGLEIIGVHTPEFTFEEQYDNVVKAVEQFGIEYPVVLDNEYATWRAYGNRYWPRKYLIDIDGFVVYDHIGEGAYEETEKKIQELLEERAAVLGIQETIGADIAKPAGIQEVDFSKPRSPEIYFGAARNTSLGNGKPETKGAQRLEEPATIRANTLYLAGDWNFTDEFAENESPEAKIIFRYKAKSVYFVASADQPVAIKILRDGKALESETKTIKDDRLYILAEDAEYGDHTLEIIIEQPGLRAFTFTFG